MSRRRASTGAERYGTHVPAERNKRIEKARATGYAEGYAEGYSEGYAEGRAEAYAEESDEERAKARDEVYAVWSQWNRRREEAALRGERFDESPPSIDDAR